MENVTNEFWMTPDGSIVFACSYDDAISGADIEIVVRIHKAGHPDEYDVVVVREDVDTEFNIRFQGGCYVYGFLRIYWRVGSDRFAVADIFVSGQCGLKGGAVSQNFSAIINSFSTQKSLDTCVTDDVEIEVDIEADISTEGGEELLIDIDVKVDDCENSHSEINQTCDLGVNESAHADLSSIVTSNAATVGSALFPYMYIRKWPIVSAGQMRRRFIDYQPVNFSPPQNSLYGSIASATSRWEIEQLALDFIEGAPPWQDQFVSFADLHSGAYAILQAVAALARRFPDSAATPEAQLQALLPPDFLLSTPYASALERLWQSYFALVILPYCDPALLAQVTRLLMTAHLLDYLFGPNSGLPQLTAGMLYELLEASIVLPRAIFPLPPAEASPPESSSPPCSDSGWVEPCAIGDLQMVRQRLLGYMPGEIAYIENVMRGERKEISRRRVLRQVDVGITETSDLSGLDNESAETRNDLFAETAKTIADKTSSKSYSNLTTSYGPPTLATTNGGPVSKTLKQGPNSEDVTRFARDILNTTVSRISRNVGTVRSSSTLNETEDTVKSTIDNTVSEHNQRFVFRWLNKVYEANVVNYGTRLMIEFMLNDPAANYVVKRDGPGGARLLLPPSPKSRGITSFEAVTKDNYAVLAAEYGATDITPPPTMTYVSAALASGEAKLVAVPAGSRARFATVNAIVPADATAPTVMVGSKVVQFPYPSVAMPSGCGATLAVSVSGYEPLTASPPTSPTAVPQVGEVLVNVVITCMPSEIAMAEWSIKTYLAIMAGYRKLCAEHEQLGHLGHFGHAPPRSLLAAREIERREIRQGCLRLIQERCAALTGSQVTTANRQAADRNVTEFRQLQSIEEMFEWNEMSCHFSGGSGNSGGINNVQQMPVNALGGGEDDPLAAFLNADAVRVMVPAHPHHVQTLLYLLSSGLVWEADNRLVPVDSAEIAIVNELKTTTLHRINGGPGGDCIGRPWEVVVPTAMQIIDDADSDLLGLKNQVQA